MVKDVLLNQYARDFNVFMSKYRAEFIRDYFENSQIDSLMDIGCGVGDVIENLGKRFIQKFKRIILIDSNFEYLEETKEKFKNKKFKFIYSDIKDLKFKEKCDLILMIDILEHVKRPLALLKQVKSFLTKNGFLVIVVPNAESLHRRIGKKMGFIKNLYELGEQDFKVGHRRYFDFESLESLIKNADYKIVFETGILLKPFPNKEMGKLSKEYCDVFSVMCKKIPRYCAEIAIIIQKK